MVAGQSGASGQPAPGPVAVESRTHTETVTTRCKSEILMPVFILLSSWLSSTAFFFFGLKGDDD